MATVYEHHNGVYQRTNAYEVENMSIDEAIETVVDTTLPDINYDYAVLINLGNSPCYIIAK